MRIITGGVSKDHRGQIKFFNEFDLSPVKRFYIIKNSDTNVIRGWRAHRLEQRWFYVLSGAFAVDLVKIDNWQKPSSDLPVEKVMLKASESLVLHVPTGHGTAFQATEQNSELLVFADYEIDHAKYDDYMWPTDYFINRQSI